MERSSWSPAYSGPHAGRQHPERGPRREHVFTWRHTGKWPVRCHGAGQSGDSFLPRSCVLAGSGKNDSSEKVAEKLEALSVKEGKEPENETKEPENETKEVAEEEQ